MNSKEIMVNKTRPRRAYDGLPGRVEAILRLFFLSVTGLCPVDPEKNCKGLSVLCGNIK